MSNSITIEKLGLIDIEVNFNQKQLEGIRFVAGDTATRGFNVLFQNEEGATIKPSPELTARLYGVNSNYPDKRRHSDGIINGDRYTIYTTTDMVSKEGTVSLQIALLKGSEAVIHTDLGDFPVGPNIGVGSSAGSDLVVDFTELTLKIKEVNQLKADYESSLEEQETIKSDIDNKHTEVTTMHAELSTTLKKELERQAAEQARNTAEEERASAESERKSSEEARKANETDRQGKESARQSTEAGRVSAENTRKDAEDIRVTNENERKTAETARANAESDRASAEIERVDAESVRVANEETRVSTQTQRDTTWEAWQDLIEDGILPPASDTQAGVLKIDKENADTAASIDTLNTELAKKVDVVSGMGLSQNSYTTVEKNKLSGIESGANKYVHPETHSLDMIEETTTKKIMTNAERTKLSGIADNANNYTHPASHAASMITESDTKRFVSDTEKTTWNAKIGSHGNITIEQIAVINKGGSTAGIPNNTLILELE